MSAPPRPVYAETARETARAAGSDFAGLVFLAEVESAISDCDFSPPAGRFIAVGNRGGQQDPAGFGEAWRRCEELQDESERAYRRKLRQWEADEPMRRQAERAYERAQRQRAAEVGAVAPLRVAAALEWMKPQSPAHLAGRI